MRIKEEFKKLGRFWHSSTPRAKVPGTLSISDGGTVELEIVHQFERRPPFGGIGFGCGGKRIVGHLENNKIVTLDDCFYKKIGGGIGISKSLIHVSRVFIGVAYNEGEIPLFNSLTFSVEGIDEWVGISGFKEGFQFEKDVITMSYQQPPDISLKLKNGMQLLITFGLRTRISRMKEAGINQKTYFILISQEARELDDFTSVVRKITHFLYFAMDQVVSLDSMSAAVDNFHQDLGRDSAGPVQVDIYYPSWPYSKDELEIQQHEMLFRFEQIQSDAGRIINNWIEAYEKINPTFDLYFSTQIGQPYLTVKFLTLVQGLEAYHHREKSLEAYRRRKKGDRELYLREKIEDVIELFKGVIGDKDKRCKLINEIVNTRNYLTHYNPEKESKAAKDEDLLPLCRKMELLFQLHFLQLIGFTREQIDAILANSISLRQKLKLP